MVPGKTFGAGVHKVISPKAIPRSSEASHSRQCDFVYTGTADLARELMGARRSPSTSITLLESVERVA